MTRGSSMPPNPWRHNHAYGVVFPQTEIGADPSAVRNFAQAAEALGYSHLICFDQVPGASAAAYDGGRRG